MIDAKNAKPTVPIIAIVNPNSGPGGSVQASYTTGISNLRSANIKVLGYVSTSYTTRPLGTNSDTFASNTVKGDINQWTSLYTIDGIFLDEMPNTAGSESYYSSATNFIKVTKGYTYSFGNPGTQVPFSYIGTVDNLCIYEGVGVPTTATLTTRVGSYAASNFSFLAHGASSLPPGTTFGQLASYVSYLYITSDLLPNPWDILPSYFTNEVAHLIPKIPKMFKLWLLRYDYPKNQSQVDWIATRSYGAWADEATGWWSPDTLPGKYRASDPTMQVLFYEDCHLVTNGAEWNAVNIYESAFGHGKTSNLRLYFNWGASVIQWCLRNDPNVLNYDKTVLVPRWKNSKATGVVIDDFPRYRIDTGPGMWNGTADEQCKEFSSKPTTNENFGDWIAHYGDWIDALKATYGPGMLAIPNYSTVFWQMISYGMLNRFKASFDGFFSEFSANPNTWGDDTFKDLERAQTDYDRHHVLVAGVSIWEPTYFWKAAWYLCARNWTTSNLYMTLPFSFPATTLPMEKGFTSMPDGYNATTNPNGGYDNNLWDNLELGTPTDNPTLIYGNGDTTTTNLTLGYVGGNVSIYVRHFTKGIVLVARYRSKTDTRVFTLGPNILGRGYQDFKTRQQVTTVSLGYGQAFIGEIPSGETPLEPQKFTETPIQTSDVMKHTLTDPGPPPTLSFSFSDPAATSETLKAYLSTVTPPPGIINYPADPIFEALQDAVFDANNNVVPIQSEYVQETVVLPAIVVGLVRENVKILTIPTIRKRHYVLFDVTAYSKNYREAWLISQQVYRIIGEKRLDFQAQGFIFLNDVGAINKYDLSTRPLTYGLARQVEVIYDEIIS